MPGYSDSVFVNCPFDDGYRDMFRAIVFTIYRCGFYPVSALSEDDGTDNRLAKIERLIAACKYGVHDISRTELNANGLPRFNMPFELGLFFGAKHFGSDEQRNKVGIIFDVDRYRYMQYISDINGVDIKDHNGDCPTAIRKIRNWLHASSRRKTIPGPQIIIANYNEFIATLPAVAAKLGFNNNEIPFNDYCYIVEEAVTTILGL